MTRAASSFIRSVLTAAALPLSGCMCSPGDAGWGGNQPDCDQYVIGGPALFCRCFSPYVVTVEGNPRRDGSKRVVCRERKDGGP